jgi:hypothetical protein
MMLIKRTILKWFERKFMDSRSKVLSGKNDFSPAAGLKSGQFDQIENLTA